MKREIRSTVGNVELRDDGENGQTITGYAAVYHRSGDPSTEYELWQGARERIMPGAFDEAVKADDVRALFNHDPSMVLGRNKAGTLRLSVDNVGLRYEVTPANTSVYKDVVEFLKRGDVDGSSFQFRTIEDNWKREGGMEIRELRKVQLFDVGPVSFPAYEGASSGVRSAEDAADAKRSREEWQASLQAEREACDKRLREIRLKELADF